jgi:hypothetical protein
MICETAEGSVVADGFKNGAEGNFGVDFAEITSL